MCTAPGSANTFATGDPGAPPDYTGALNLILPLRITDQSNSGPAGGPYTADATMVDTNFAVALDCAVTRRPLSAHRACPGTPARTRSAAASPTLSA